MTLRRLPLPAFVALCLGLVLMNHAADPIPWEKLKDFQSNATGFGLAGHPDRYDPAAHLRYHRDVLHVEQRLDLVSPRMPWWDFAWSWLAGFDVHSASVFWRLLNIAAFAVFAFLMPVDRRMAWLATAASFPAASSIAMGQDLGVALVPVAAALRLHGSGMPVLAGSVLALAGAKWHFLLFVPLAIIASREWRLLAGLAGGAAWLLALSEIVQPGWIPAYVQLVTLPWREPGQKWVLFPEIMVSLPGLTAPLPGLLGLAICTAGAAALATATWVVGRRHGFPLGLAVALIAGVLTSNHVYFHDAVFLLPALLVILAETGWHRLIWPQLTPWYMVLPWLVTGWAVVLGRPWLGAYAAQVRQVVIVGLALVTVWRLAYSWGARRTSSTITIAARMTSAEPRS